VIQFLLKGLLRDRSRSLLPVLIVAAGVMLTVFLHAWLNGAISTMIQLTANYSTGHVRVMTRAYAKEADQVPNDLALLGIDTLIAGLKRDFPDLLWAPRTKFGGLLDIPDEKGETRVQTPISGLAVGLFSIDSPERKILNIQKAIIKGCIPQNQGEILIGDELAEKLNLRLGDVATLISSTMYGSMAIANFKIAGTVRFGVGAMDRGALIADLSDIQQALDMNQGAGEILGFFTDDIYHDEQAKQISVKFNTMRNNLKKDEFSPIMGILRNESGLSDYLDLIGIYIGIIISVFVTAMSIVLWNVGLTGGLRRYGEIGVRLAIGEDKGHVYRSIMAESIMIGIIGSTLGTAIGLASAYYLQVKGIDISSMMKNSTLMFSDVVRAQVTPFTFVIGFFPGLLATFLGAAISGIGIYKRQTSQLFKELET
jgi:putative ABC transport system permease protein